MESNGGIVDGWSDAVEDLVDRGDVEGAISALESVISNLETLDHASSPPSDDLRLASAVGDLADLHSSLGFSLNADELRSRALLIRARALHPPPSKLGDSKPSEENAHDRDEVWVLNHSDDNVPDRDEIRVLNHSDDNLEDEYDWEAVADRVASGKATLSSQQEERVVSNPSQKDPPLGTPRRRGRGSFLYKKSCLYSDQPDVETTSGNNSGSEDEVEARGQRHDDEADGHRNSRFATGHVLVLYDFSPSTRTIDLEKLFDNFRDRGFAIKWVNDTVALAVFRTSFIAHEAQNSVRCPFRVRPLGEEDNLLTQISPKDLEPPLPRPKTSARTAQRLIAQGMGMKPCTNFGSNELRKQEEARKNRILARQIMKDDAWGSDKP